MADEALQQKALQATVEALWRYGIPLSEVKDPKLRDALRKQMEKQRN